ncbi:DUF1858 domain-containing protein [Candidatus Pacearchaeota archaeon]|nr:DUF1858 domain-containing protein [Candidatus Pacearchaeota archaeon]
MDDIKITKQTPIKELIEAHPETQEILMSYGLHCVGCHFSEFDTLEDGAMLHGLSDEDIDLMVKDVNEVVGKKEKPKAF